jgi:hypothetical protein
LEHKKIRGDTQARREQSDFITLCLFFQNKESRLKMYWTLLAVGWLRALLIWLDYKFFLLRMEKLVTNKV